MVCLAATRRGIWGAMGIAVRSSLYFSAYGRRQVIGIELPPVAHWLMGQTRTRVGAEYHRPLKPDRNERNHRSLYLFFLSCVGNSKRLFPAEERFLNWSAFLTDISGNNSSTATYIIAKSVRQYEGGIVSLRRTGGIVSTGFAVELNFMILLYYLEEDTVRKLKG